MLKYCGFINDRDDEWQSAYLGIHPGQCHPEWPAPDRTRRCDSSTEHIRHLASSDWEFVSVASLTLYPATAKKSDQ